MKNFKLSEKDILSNQDWTFPTTTYYGPGRFNEIGKFCEEFEIKNPLIVTDSGSKDLQIGRAHVRTPVTSQSRMPSSA